MKGDFSRQTFNSARHYAGVLKQQGRVDLDADWNEQVAIQHHRAKIEALDVIGKCGAPLHHAGFHIVTDAASLTPVEQELAGNQQPPECKPGNFLISAGRAYVDGLLCENEQMLTYATQPDLPGAELLGDEGFYLIYLDVWQRHITVLDDPLIREKALGGPDTTTRVKTVWQVKTLPLKIAVSEERQKLKLQLAEVQQQLSAVLEAPRTRQTSATITKLNAQIAQLEKQMASLPPDAAATCGTHFEEWDVLTAPGTGKLNARTTPADPANSPCLLPPTAGYQRLENQLYRVEIHSVDANGGVTFVWSRDNGTVATSIQSVSGSSLVVADLGRDEMLGFEPGQWVEMSDDELELNGKPGTILQIAAIDEAARKISLTSAPADLHPAAHPKLRRWDQKSALLTATYDWQPLEDGVEVRLSAGTYQTGDYWLIPARTATGEIEWPPYQIPNIAPEPQRPLGIRHHYCRLAMAQVDATGLQVIEDCRAVFPPLTELPDVETGKGFYVTELRVNSHALVNDAKLPVDQLVQGLQIVCSANVALESIREKPVCAIALELPFPTQPDLREMWGKSVIGFQPMILDGVLKADGATIYWNPASAAQAWLEKHLFIWLKRNFELDRVLARLTVRGSFVWNDKDPNVYLDGDVFGINDPPSAETHLRLPSGDYCRGGNLEMWFWLVPPLPQSPVPPGPRPPVILDPDPVG